MKLKLLSISILFSFVFLLLSLGIGVKSSYAVTCGVPVTGIGVELPSHPVTTSHTITVDLSSNINPSENFTLSIEDGFFVDSATSPSFRPNETVAGRCNSDGCLSVQNGVVTWDITAEKALKYTDGTGNTDTYYVDLVNGFGSTGPDQCDVGTYAVTRLEAPGAGCTIDEVSQTRGQICYQNQAQNACFQNGLPITVVVSGLKSEMGNPWNGEVGLDIAQEGFPGEWDGFDSDAVNGSATLSFVPNAASFPADFVVTVEDRKYWNEKFDNCKVRITVSQGCSPNQCEITPTPIINDGVITADPYVLCKQIDQDILPQQYEDCVECVGGENPGDREGIWTAIGCIKREPTQIAQALIKTGIFMGGGIGLLMILVAGFIITTSEGNPKRFTEGKDMFIAVGSGLIFIVFSVVILEFAGYTIFRIPGFGG